MLFWTGLPGGRGSTLRGLNGTFKSGWCSCCFEGASWAAAVLHILTRWLQGRFKPGFKLGGFRVVALNRAAACAASDGLLGRQRFQTTWLQGIFQLDSN